MSSIPPVQICFVRGDKLVARGVHDGPAMALSVVPEAVKVGAVGVEGRVLVDSVRGHFDGYSGGEVLSVGEGDAF